MATEILNVLLPGVIAFIIGIAITPFVTHILYARKAWKKTSGKHDLEGNETPIFNALHQSKEVGTPRMGGVVIWLSVIATTLLFTILARLTSDFEPLDFLERSQTWLPFAALLVGAVIGLVDDLFEIRGKGFSSSPRRGGLPLGTRLLMVVIAGLFAGWWFYAKLDVSSIGVPFYGPLELAWLIIPLFVLVMVGLYTSGVIDGIDGLSGGVFASVFAAYALIAFTQGQYDLAAFTSAVLGALLAFLWFNVPPARFYMSETGSMALMLALAVIVFMTDTLGEGEGVLLLPLIGFLLVVTAASSVLQIFWKKVFKRKLFSVAPLHHYFESIGWPSYKITMRYWILGVLLAFLGVIVALIS